MTQNRKKLLPAALVLTATSGCGPSKCDPQHEVCMPDGGSYCTHGCVPHRGLDGGVETDADGRVVCVC